MLYAILSKVSPAVSHLRDWKVMEPHESKLTRCFPFCRLLKSQVPSPFKIFFFSFSFSFDITEVLTEDSPQFSHRACLCTFLVGIFGAGKLYINLCELGSYQSSGLALFLVNGSGPRSKLMGVERERSVS